MRRNTGSTSQTISLFPFLAVLICMMGALVLLLLGLTSTMRQRLDRPSLVAIRAPAVAQPADGDAPRPPPPPGPGGFDQQTLAQSRARQEQECEARWQSLIRQTTSDRDAVRAALQGKQNELLQRQARLDELAALLKSQVDQAISEQATAEMLQERKKQAELELDSVSREIALTERKLEELKQQQATASNAHAILPYDGRSGTTRRPIYIECSEKGYRFLPEDVFVGPNELRGATPHSNALAFGAKALLRYWTLRNARDPAHHPRPYLLLIVRPGGVFAYDAARQLLSRLESSFGYELVEDEIILQKLPPDPQAVTLLKEAIALAVDIPGERSPTSRTAIPGDGSDEERQDLSAGNVDLGTGRGDRAKADAPEFPESDRDLPGNAPAQSGPTRWPESGSSRPGNSSPPPGGARPRTVRDPLPKARPANLGGRPGVPIESQNASRMATSAEMAEESSPPRRLPSFSTSRGAGQSEASAGATVPPGAVDQQPEYAGPNEAGATLSELVPGNPAENQGPGTVEKENVPKNSDSGLKGDLAKEGTEPRRIPSGTAKAAPEFPASGAPGRPRNLQPEPVTQESPSGPRTNERAPIHKPGEAAESASAAGEMTIMPPRGTRGGGAPRNLIALQRKILIRVEPDRVWVGEVNPIEIPIKKNQKADQLIAQVTSAMHDVVESWGPPPARFYWNPAVRFEVTREGNPVYERLRGAFERQKVKSSIDFVEPNSRQAARRTP